MAIAWTNDLSTGIDVIDNQHKRIVDYINELESAMAQHDHSGVGTVLNELVDYTLSHFAFEESLLDEAEYEFTKAHKSIHHMFTKRVSDFQNRHNTSEDVADQLHDMLSTWLIHHIKRDDMAYVPDIKSSIANKNADHNEGGWLGKSLGRFFRKEAH